MLDTTISRRIAAAMEHLTESGRRAVARSRLLSPIVGSVQDVDEFGLSILRPVRATEAAQEYDETLARFTESMRRLSHSTIAAAEPAADAVIGTVPVAAKCKLVPSDAGITGEL